MRHLARFGRGCDPAGVVHPQDDWVLAHHRVRLALRHPWADGTTHAVFDPVEFLGRPAVLVPRARVNLILRGPWRVANSGRI